MMYKELLMDERTEAIQGQMMYETTVGGSDQSKDLPYMPDDVRSNC